jgi:hypothetical protein
MTYKEQLKKERTFLALMVFIILVAVVAAGILLNGKPQTKIVPITCTCTCPN